MKWWDWMPWSLFSECWALSQLFHSPLYYALYNLVKVDPILANYCWEQYQYPQICRWTELKDLSHQIVWSTECLTLPWTPSGCVEGQQLPQRRISLYRGRWRMPYLFSHRQQSWHVPACSGQNIYIYIYMYNGILFSYENEEILLCNRLWLNWTG